MCFIKRSIKAYLCQKYSMINFDGINFSERRSEEVFFFLRSV